MRPPSRRERQIIELARLIRDHSCYIVGTGLPLLGAVLGKRCYAPQAQLLLESGFIGVTPQEAPSSVTDLRLMCSADLLWDPCRYLGLQANSSLSGRQELTAFIGGAQIDAYGNLNSTMIGSYQQTKVRFAGSGGANGIASYCDTIVVIRHDVQHFVQQLDYLTSPGWLDGADARQKRGLPAQRGPRCVISDLGRMRFDSLSRRMYLEGWYDYTTPREIQEHTGFELDVSRAQPLPPPPDEVVRILREEIDPHGIYI